MSHLDLNLVRVFVAIYETRSVTQAAERLDVTQPTISYGLAKLRKMYADRLFMRSSDGLIATGLAEQLFERYRDALTTIESTLEQNTTFDPLRSTRRFRLAMSDIGVLYFVPPLLRRFQEAAPHIEIDIVQIPDALGEDLSVGRLDMAIGNIPVLASPMHSVLLFREHYVCLMSANHPTIGERMSLKEFSSARHVMVSSPRSGHFLIEEVLAERGINRNIVARVPQFTVLPQLLSQSDLLVLLPSRVASLYVLQGGLKSLPLPVPLPDFKVQAHWHARQEYSAAHRWLVDEIVQTLSKL
ncbi:DNA-binding transcriptional LysR family regulator [Variovorax sp. OAS795]|uniref:LysR family transcriptional regulator n=1 Tax=Variovorax sp. OAS795 TaxID=3034231 RepID=UPI00339819F3